MQMLRALRAIPIIACSSNASAHSFGESFLLPLPVSFYIFGSCAALLFSFLIISLMPVAQFRCHQEIMLWKWRVPSLIVLMKSAFRSLTVIIFMLAILTGFIGSQSSYANINMTLFWIIFVLLVPWLSAIVGDLSPILNPWRILADCASKFLPRHWPINHPIFVYPARFAYWPAVLFYVLFIWYELLGDSQPRSLSYCLTTYTFINIIGVSMWGRHRWFHYCELFSVIFRMLALLAPVRLSKGVSLQPSAILAKQDLNGPLSVMVFIVFMLSSTSFDGLHETSLWKNWYFYGLRDFWSIFVGSDPVHGYVKLKEYFLIWQSAWLGLLLIVYLVVYLTAIKLALYISRSGLPLLYAAAYFSHSLIPIALCYHFSHYFSLIQTQGLRIFPLLFDPFGWGWNVFGSASWFRSTSIPDLEFVWMAQVGIIVLGHILAAYFSHQQAIKLFQARRLAFYSQLPIMALMVSLTAFGLRILSLPFS